MADYIKRVMTSDGPKQIDYTALANLPTIDSTVRAGSTNAVQGGAVYTELAKKLNAVNGKAASSQDSDKLGGYKPDHYATAQSVKDLQGNLEGSVSDSLEELSNTKAPVNHAVSATTYGVGDNSKYGHIKLSDSTESTDGVSAGFAATPGAVKKAYDLANTANNTASAAMPKAGGKFTGAVEYTTLTGGNITVSGGITASGNITGAKVFGAVYNDYAEFFPRGEETEIGDLVALDMDAVEEQYIKAIRGNKCLAIHTGEYAHLIGGEKAPEGEDYFEYNIKKYIPVALTGRVHVKVIGKVKKGDYIVASDIPGVGIAGDKENSVGYCVENNNNEEVKLVKVRVV